MYLDTTSLLIIGGIIAVCFYLIGRKVENHEDRIRDIEENFSHMFIEGESLSSLEGEKSEEVSKAEKALRKVMKKI